MKLSETKLNKELEMAYEFVYHTNNNIFLTGKAGTGKTTFLHKLRKDCPKRMVVVAPTGVAAINAGGVTIHSMFQLPFAPFFPESSNLKNNPLDSIKYRKHKIRLIKSMELLVIDEISMVRADVLDAIDSLLRRYKNRNLVFGGVQLLMIGDVHQLPPVVKDYEWNMLKFYYKDIYFFSSYVYKLARPVVIELKQVFRQKDITFINLLEKIRTNGLDKDSMNLLNKRYKPNFDTAVHSGYIILTTHNAQAESINGKRLEENPNKVFYFDADIEGDFPEYNFPTYKNLSLKEGAQVMFVKNDLNPEKRYYNGKIGEIVHIEENKIVVQCPEDDDTIDVSRVSWSNIKFSLNEATKEIEEEEIGSFTQFPLKLAWAITIHKSQGLTFDKVVVDAERSFAHGQVYVALSRCRSLDGLVLSSQIAYSSIITDYNITDFNRKNEDAIPTEKDLSAAKQDFYNSLLIETFNFESILKVLVRLKNIILSAGTSVSSMAITDIENIVSLFNTNIYLISQRFKIQLEALFTLAQDEEGKEILKERVIAAANYFSKELIAIYDYTKFGDFDSDNMSEEDQIKNDVEELQKITFISLACMKSLLDKFDVFLLLRIRSNADLNFKFEYFKRINNKPSVEIEYIELYAELKKWRDTMADESGMERYRVMPNSALEQMSNTLPTTIEELKKIKGLGKKKINFFAKDLLQIIAKYCIEKRLKNVDINLLKISENELNKITKKEPKGASSKITLNMLKEGYSISQIAAERGFAVSTIVSHIEKHIDSGEISALQIMDKAKAEKIATALINYKFISLKDTKEYFGNDVEYYEIRWIMAEIKKQSEM